MNLKFWEKKKKPKVNKGFFREWFDAIVFAVIAATIIRLFLIEAYTIPTSSMEKSLLIGDFLFVSKVSYGPRIPNTPIAFPFAHHTMPLTGGKSYLEWVKLPYYRLPGFSSIKNNDVVVFNYPMEDFRPVDKRENYIKRCVGIPGDTLEVRGRVLYVNGKEAEMPPHMQYGYNVKTDGSGFNPKVLRRLDITEGGRVSNQGDFSLTMTEDAVKQVKSFNNVTEVTPAIARKGEYAEYIFPNSDRELKSIQGKKFFWNVDNFGPVWIPKKGETVPLTPETLPVYERAIALYEGNDLKIEDGMVFINGVERTEYTFEMDYYFMMGDNRHNSADSRFWGFVPEDHIVGKAVFIWLSMDNMATSFSEKIRWRRIFNVIR